jgi:CRP-like cAMP-binding protein
MATLPSAKPASSGDAARRPARKLAQYAPVSPAERSALDRLLRAKVQRIAAGVPLVEVGGAPGDILVVLDGWACRHRSGPNGRRHIVALHLPGDICDLSVFLMRAADSSVTALSDMRVAAIGRAALAAFTREQPRLTQSFWWDALSAASIQRQWLVRNTLGARERIAGLLCELAARLYAVGLATDAGFALPLTQYDLADACGMTSEHTNRTLRELRRDGLIGLEDGQLRLLDWDGLESLAGFDPAYLHFRTMRSEPVVEAGLPI